MNGSAWRDQSGPLPLCGDDPRPTGAAAARLVALSDRQPAAGGPGADLDVGVCILDERGTVVAINGDIQHFLQPQERLELWPSILGMDYFHLLSHCSSFSSTLRLATEITNGVRAVISGRLPSYSAVCQRPDADGLRAYRLKASRLHQSALSIVTYQSLAPSSPASAGDHQRDEHLAAHLDALTRLPNRVALHARIRAAQRHCVAAGHCAALFFIDLDDFKAINDNFGHQVGDHLLMMVGQRLQAVIGSRDLAARLSGDEFAILLGALSGERLVALGQAHAVAEQLRASLAEPYRFALEDAQGLQIRCSGSIGVTLFQNEQDSPEALLKQADLAMYAAKACAHAQVSFFSTDLEDAARQRNALEGELQRALEQEQFCLYYQIQVDQTSRPIGAEALIRWRHPERGLLGPEQFIPLAEQSALICGIGTWVIGEACRQLREWEDDARLRHLVLAVNVSARQFQQNDFVDVVCRLILDSGAPARKLKFELTETVIFDDIAATVSKLQQLREIGVRFSLDDFGVGYSSLAYLQDMPIDQIKIDRSFVSDIVGNAKSEAIVRTLIRLSQELGLSVIAEGVEREEQRVFLENMGCQLQQGYLYNRPQTQQEFLQTVLRLTRQPLP